MEKPTDKQIAILQKNNKAVPATKQEATVVIGELFAKSDEAKATTLKVNDEKFHSKQNNQSYYVAYVKDLVIAVIEAQKLLPKEDKATLDAIMESCIFCIKMAVKEFEQQ